MIIGIGGPTASGKTTIATLIENVTGARRTRYSDILAEIARERGLSTDKATLQNLFLTERETRGESFLADEMETRMRNAPNTHLIIEGNRRLADIAALRRLAHHRNERLVLIFIDASTEIRFARFNARRTDDALPLISWEAFMTLENNGAENELGQLRELFRNEGVVVDANSKTPNEILEELKPLLE